MGAARAACFSLAALASSGVAAQNDKALDIAIVGGGVAGTVTALELLKRNQTGSLTIFEQGPSIGHNKSASGIIAAILGFSSIYKYWLESIPFMKLREFLALRAELPRTRFVSFFGEWAYAKVKGDKRMQRETHKRFFNESRAKLEEMLDAFPELCGAVVGPFCCREGSEARLWMESKQNQQAYNVSCEGMSGVAHIFSEKNDAICDLVMADKQKFSFLPSEAARAACQADQANLKEQKPAVNLLTLEGFMQENLFAGLWNSADEGFVRVEDFYPIAQKIFERRGVNMHTSCSVRRVQPNLGKISRQPEIRVLTTWSCLHGKGKTFDRVIVAAGANTVNLLAQHDRRIASQLMPVKGFAVKTDAPQIKLPLRQMGFEHEDLGHYIRPQANGGVSIGYGREIGIFQDQLLDPTFEGWKLGTGPNATGLGREVLAHDHVGLAGFRPFSVYEKFPLIKQYKGDWEGLFVNTGFGFYGYCMAWKSAEVVVDVVLGLQPEGWADSWEEDEGPLICTRGVLQVVNVVIVGIAFSLLFALICYWPDIKARFTRQNGEQQIGEHQNGEHQNPLVSRSPRLIKYDYAPLHRVLDWGKVWIVVHFGGGILACFLAFFDLNKTVGLVMLVKAVGVLCLQCSTYGGVREDLDKIRLKGEESSFLGMLWFGFCSLLDSIDQELDGINAGKAMSLGWSRSSTLPSRVKWAKSHYQQQWQCVPYIGFLLARLGPYHGVYIHFFVFTLFQLRFCMGNVWAARETQNELTELLSRRDTSCNDWFEKSEEFWRRCVHAFDLCGLHVAKEITLDRFNEASLVVRERSQQPREKGPPGPRCRGRYGKLQIFGLKVALESGGSLILLTTTAAVTLDFLSTTEVVVGASSVVSSSFSIMGGIWYQLTHHKDIKENMTVRWYGWAGFLGQRCIVVMLGMVLLFSWMKVFGIWACGSHVLDLTNGCVDFSPEDIYSLPWSWPAKEMRVLYGVSFALIFFAGLYFLCLAYPERVNGFIAGVRQVHLFRHV